MHADLRAQISHLQGFCQKAKTNMIYLVGHFLIQSHYRLYNEPILGHFPLGLGIGSSFSYINEPGLGSNLGSYIMLNLNQIKPGTESSCFQLKCPSLSLAYELMEPHSTLAQ